MKKIGCILTAVIEIAALAGAYIIHYYTERKLGMIRYVNFKNMTWEREYPIEILKTSCVVVILTLTIATFILCLKKRRELTRWTKVMNVGMVIFTALYVGYSFSCSVELMADYYFISGLFLLTAVVQVIKTGALVIMTGTKGRTNSEK